MHSKTGFSSLIDTGLPHVCQIFMPDGFLMQPPLLINNKTPFFLVWLDPCALTVAADALAVFLWDTLANRSFWPAPFAVVSQLYSLANRTPSGRGTVLLAKLGSASSSPQSLPQPSSPAELWPWPSFSLDQLSSASQPELQSELCFFTAMEVDVRPAYNTERKTQMSPAALPVLIQLAQVSLFIFCFFPHLHKELIPCF